MLAKLSIRFKIVAIVTFLLVTMALLGGFAVLQMRAINASAHDIQSVWLPSVRWLGELRTNVNRYRSVVREHLLAIDAKGKTANEERLAVVAKEIAAANQAYQPLISSAEEKAMYDQAVKFWAEYRKITDEVLEYSRILELEKAREMNAEHATPAGLKADEVLKKLVDYNNAGAETAAKEAERSYGRALWLLLATLGAVTIAGLCAAIFVVRDISRGIQSIMSPMRALGEGDLSAVVPHQGENTEIGQMADTLQVFKDALIAKKAADQAAAADAEAKIQRGQRVDAVTREFEAMVGTMVTSLSSASTELEAAAHTLTSTAETTQQLSGSAAAASRDVSDNVQSVAAASEEITSSVNEISRQVQESSRVAQSAVQQAQMTDASIAELAQAAARIGDVVKLITAVAEQTNLLALNATIEAARAGEAGRGFAVVASEVKALAAQTAKATEEISTQIEGMQSATETSVNAIREIGKTISSISEISSTIAAAVEEQGAATKEIARNMQEAARLSTQVASNVTDVNKGAGETGSASTQVLASAQSLSKESGQLQLEVDRFLTALRAA
ncbi:methyl-accepting chemotaxis protein [Bradyrhizobium sp. LHD-71]|uniref:methyl-accepting chemotaxis protein n=1 Tax=Bradyrhizobium sp. LHD-71 TaxID=3072141 RepID=UPI00280F112A|nr:methyl-accepting chemotaxis protein [Bradyrhizobium sp. LHD-71]MDQ8731993.1 methyl-accepting chemotaxis protein [Bradyrhizobium sp. LHD-71]